MRTVTFNAAVHPLLAVAVGIGYYLLHCCLAQAQTSAATTQSAQPDARAELGEIVVTAQRREERLGNVPMTIAAFDGEQLRAAGATELEDVAALVTNTQIFQNNGSGAPVWIIRGVGIVDFNTNNTPTAAVYLDDIYQVSSVFGSIALFDIERVEVLKGPQGGLYGRNTSGGAVRVITRSPNLREAEGDVLASYSRWSHYTGEVSASFPLVTDQLAVRLSGRIDKSSDGWQYSIPTGERHGEYDAYGVRAQLLAQPNDAFDVRLILDTGSDDSEIVLPRARGYYVPGAGSPCQAILEGRNDDTCLTFQQAVTGSGPSPSLQSENGERVLADPFSRNNNDTVGATLLANFTLGDLTLTSVSGYRDFDFGQLQENDAVPGEYGHQVSGSFFEAWSQEFRLASAAGQRLSWIIGAGYGRDTLNERREFLARDNPVFTAIFGSPLIFKLFYDQESESWAGFAQADYALTSAFTLSGAVRYTDEEKTYRNGGIGLPAAANIFTPPLSDDYELESNWSGKASIQWKPAESSLLYASASRGFKSGGFFGGFGFAGQSAIRPYKEETVSAYEIGSKNTLQDGRISLNLAAFYYDYKDVQSFATEQDPILGTITRLRNVGDARHVGAELETVLMPTAALRIGASVGYLDAQIHDSPNDFFSAIGEVLTFNDSQRLYAPEWSWTAYAFYEVPIASAGALQFLVDANGRSTLVTGADVLATGEMSLVDDAIKRTPGYTLVNGRVTYESRGGGWAVSLFGRNLTDEVYRTVWGGDGLGSGWTIRSEPMSYGIEATVRW
jgi:iron complex outermembrane receptor protein